jgi:proteasome accessory factor B
LEDRDVNKAQKLVQILELMIRRGGIRAEELKDRFELDDRSLRRYLADLREIDVPIREEGRAEDRVVSVEAVYRRTGVQLSLAEVLSLHFGRTLFDFLEGTSFAEDLEGAIERLEPAISRAHQDLARQLDTRFLAVREPTKDYRGTASEVLDELVTALVYNNPVDARYRKPTGLPAARVLHPYTLATFRQGLYLFAFDTEASGVRTFAIERFLDVVRRRGERFTMPVGWKPQAHMATAFGIITGPPVEVVLAFDEAVTAYVRERTWHPTQTFRTLSDGRLELRMFVADTVELRTFVFGFGAQVEVIEPLSMRAEIASGLRTAARRYGDS